MYQKELLYIKTTLSPGASSVIVVPCLKFAGVIVTAFVPEVDEFKIIFTWPSVDAVPKVQGAVADVAFTKVVLSVNVIAVDVEPSPVIDCGVSLNEIKEGMLLNKSAAASASPKSVNAVIFLSAICFSC